MNKLRIFLAEDHALVREGLKMLIDSQPDMVVVGEAEDGQIAVQQAKESSPDVAVVDVVLPNVNGAAVTEQLVRENPDIRVLALTVRQDLAYVRQMMSAGARGYILKLTKPSDFLQAVRTVAKGGIHIDPHVNLKTVTVNPLIAKSVDQRLALTNREIELIQLVVHGYSNKEIAERLDVSVKSIETYKTRIMEKLGFRSRVQLIQFAIHQGWLTPSQTG